MKRFFLATAIALGLFVTAAVSSAAPDPKQLQIVPKISPLPGVQRPGDKDLQAYLFVYFKDETHSIYFAASTDGYTFTDINAANPIFLGKDLAEQKGVRDPHIMRGPDNAFYLSMTDLHIFAREAGMRTTEWERPGDQYGWGNNRAMIFMKSYDLIHWTYSSVRIAELFPDFKDIGAAWAPETIFDPA